MSHEVLAGLIDLETLTRLTSARAIEEARDAMDLECVSGMRISSQGRLEGGVKPAPPSTEKPAYVKITRRGDRFRVDCRIHGRNNWCLHAVILVLRHLGLKPNYQVRRAPEKTRPRLGFEVSVDFDAARAFFRVRSLSTGHFLISPLRYLLKEAHAFGLTPRARELFEDLADGHEHGFEIARLDLGPVLAATENTTWRHPAGEPWHRRPSPGEAPFLTVRIEDEVILWETEPKLKAGSVFVPGWPGFIIADHKILRVPGYVPDLQHLSARDGSLPLSADNLLPFLLQKHRIQWCSPKPTHLCGEIHFGLDLHVDNRQLAGRLGVRHGDLFLPLPDLDHEHQLIRSGRETILLSTNHFHLSQLSRDSRRIKAPWQGTNFRIRENQAPKFLQELRPPGSWHTERTEADRWFGLSRLEMSSTWPKGSLEPCYHIGRETFSHPELLHGLQDGGFGVCLPNGRVLNADCTPVLQNQNLLSGIEAIHQDETARKKLLRRLLKQDEDEKTETLVIPDTWRRMLRTYQLEGVTWLLENFKNEEPALLADDMGLGKTIQALAFLDCIREDLPQLIVVPTSLLMNWREECRKFAPHRQVTIHHGSGRLKSAETLQKKDLVITSYGTVRRDLEFLYDVSFQTVVLDEAQAIKNAASQSARAVCELMAHHRVALTGTPVENRLTELWSIFHFLAPGYLGDEAALKSFILPGTPGFRTLQAKVAPFLKRRLKTEVEKDLPEKQEITITLPLGEAQADLYRRFLRDSVKDLEGNTNTVSMLTKLLRLRQVCCHPGLVDEWCLTAESNKLGFLVESLEEVLPAGHAVLVFSQFTQLLKLVKYELEEREMDFLYLDGATRNRQDLVDRFQAGEAPIFLISLKAGGTGLNLTRASYVYHLDPWWNPMVEAQATDRAHRIGQTRKVISYKLISEQTIEEKILKLQAGKRLLADGLWDGTGKGLDRELLLELLT